MPRKAILMQCPHCKKRGRHESPDFDKQFYKWSAERTPFFQRIAGSDLSFRQRTRECEFPDCGKGFVVVEMWDGYLRTLMGEVERLENENKRLERAVVALKTGIEQQVELEREEWLTEFEGVQAMRRELRAQCAVYRDHFFGMNTVVHKLVEALDRSMLDELPGNPDTEVEVDEGDELSGAEPATVKVSGDAQLERLKRSLFPQKAERNNFENDEIIQALGKLCGDGIEIIKRYYGIGWEYPHTHAEISAHFNRTWDSLDTEMTASMRELRMTLRAR